MHSLVVHHQSQKHEKHVHPLLDSHHCSLPHFLLRSQMPPSSPFSSSLPPLKSPTQMLATPSFFSFKTLSLDLLLDVANLLLHITFPSSLSLASKSPLDHPAMTTTEPTLQAHLGSTATLEGVHVRSADHARL